MNRVVVPLEGVVFGTEAERQAAIVAAGTYLEVHCGIEDGARLVRGELSSALKACEGLERGSELTWAMLFYLLSALPPMLRPELGAVRGLADVEAGFRAVSLRYRELIGRTEADLSALRDDIGLRGGGRVGFRAAVGGDTIEAYILEDVIELLFTQAYITEEGWRNETLQVDAESLATIAARCRLECVSRYDPDLAHARLDAAGIGDVFSGVHSQENGARLPWNELVAPAMAGEVTTYLVCADRAMVKAAQSNGAIPIGFAPSSVDRRPLQEAGCRAVLSRLVRLANVFLKNTG